MIILNNLIESLTLYTGGIFFVRRRRFRLAPSPITCANQASTASTIQEPIRHTRAVTGHARNQRDVCVSRHLDETTLEPSRGQIGKRS